ncbi:hypothetical protein PENDEC_c008G02836 [Penicillium decumbens]|uniref:Restriction of telomere capping protein 4 n=1 Tax=Penicillium decumbens TaxID=69771 RepID=A0A1V6PDR9_PENDC|nr:hypothetical protein PENDEC_c008G02836 [Penicillium decumbens]
MRARTKPDSSYASNRLTRRGLDGRGHLLSTFNKSPNENDALPTTESNPKLEPAIDDEPQSDSDDTLSTLSSDAIDELEVKSESGSKGEGSAHATDVELPSIEKDFDFDDEDFMSRSKSKLDDPGTDDEPLSSSEDESDDDAGEKTQKTQKTLQEKIDAEKIVEERSKGSTRKYNGDDESGEKDFDAFAAHTRRAKRQKGQGYSRTKSGSTYPSSSARSAVATPHKRSRQYKSDSKKGNEDTQEKEAFPAFKIPMQIDISSPPKPGTGDIKESNEYTFPQASNSNSSMGTLFSNDPLSMSLDDSDSPLSSVPSSPEPRKSLCPMCKEEVDPELLMRFEAQPKQRIREQQQFCASHKQNAAEKEWQAQGYPEINWDTFDERIQKHFPNLEKLLVPDCTSYYRNILDTTLKSGQAKNFRLTLAGEGIETISCGYYGTKGAGKLLQAIIDRFSLRLRRLASSDHIVKTAGVAGYAQSVLVPELAVRLVKEDMSVSDDAARQILRQSMQLGQKLNPAVDDVVPVPTEGEEDF